jgi:hypothetical protein
MTGNGTYDGVTNFGGTFLKLNSSLVLQDWFAPAEQALMNRSNYDLGSGGAAVLANVSSGAVKHLLIGGGKWGGRQLGEIYVLNRDALGHLEDSGSPLVQKFPTTWSLYATPAFWNNTLFIIAGENGPLQALRAESRHWPVQSDARIAVERSFSRKRSHAVGLLQREFPGHCLGARHEPVWQN